MRISDVRNLWIRGSKESTDVWINLSSPSSVA